MNTNNLITDSYTLTLLRRALTAYRTIALRYKQYAPTWKTDAPWERYWRDMNTLEDRIDAILALREIYNFKTDDSFLVRYEAIQEIRYFVTTAYAP